MAAPASPPATLHAVLDERARQQPAAPAITFEGRMLDYAQLAAASRHTASLLSRDFGIAPGQRVAWLGANHPAQLVLLFALARQGAMLLPLNFRLAAAEWDAMMADCTPSLVVHDGAWAEAATSLASRHGVAAIDGRPLAGLDADSSAATAAGASSVGETERSTVASGEVDPQAPALLVYTSGTTSRPKGAVHTHANLLANMRIAAQVQGMTPADRVATVLPMFHVGGLCIQTLPALGAGAHVLLHARFSPEATLECFAHERPTLTLLVPATMKALVDDPRWASTDLSSLRAVWAGSSLLPAPLLQAFHARGVPVCNVYGATETGPFSIALPPEHALARVGSCGWPAPGVQACLHEVQQGAGELWIRGPNVVRRYWPDLPACDNEGWFHTGDLAMQDADGAYTVVGRARDLIISGGENIHPAQVEAVAAEHPDVLECAAFGLADEQWGEVVALAVVARAGAQLHEGALREHMAARLARYKLPRRWFFVDALPKTALGKVQRQALVRALRET